MAASPEGSLRACQAVYEKHYQVYFSGATGACAIITTVALVLRPELAPLRVPSNKFHTTGRAGSGTGSNLCHYRCAVWFKAPKCPEMSSTLFTGFVLVVRCPMLLVLLALE